MRFTSLTNLLTGFALAGIISCGIKEANYTEEPLQSTTEENINTHKVQLIDDYNNKSLEDLTISSNLMEGNIIRFGNYTQDYDKKNFEENEKEKLPIPYRYTKLNSEWSEVYIIHSKETKISGISQNAYFVPNHGWEELRPYKEHKEARQLVKGSEKLLDWTLRKIPFSEDVLNIILKKAEKTKQEYYSELLNKTNKNYIIEKIPAHIPAKLIGLTETAREYDIAFDLESLKELSSETYLIANIYLGDPSKASANSFSNKRGELENLIIKFNLEKKVKENQDETGTTQTKIEISKKQFTVCIDYKDGQYGQRRDGKSDIEEIIFYIRKENSNWEEFDKSQNVCTNEQIILENPNSFIEVRAKGKFGNGRGNFWFFDYAPQGKKISWNSEEKIILKH